MSGSDTIIYPATTPPKGDCPLYGLDIETAKRIEHPWAGLDPYMTKISLIQLYNPHEKKVYIYDVLESGLEGLKEFFATHAFVSHNAKFEITHLQRAGVVFEKPVHCTMLMSQLINAVAKPKDELTEDEEDTPIGEKDGLGAYKNYSNSLESCSLRWFNKKLSKQYQTSNWGERPLSKEQIEYAAEDAVVCFDLFLLFIKLLKKYKMEEIYSLQRRTLFPIVDMEVNGIAFNWSKHREQIAKWKKDFELADTKAKEIFGGINLGSPKQMGAWLTQSNPKLLPMWPRTDPSKRFPEGQLSFTQTSLADFRHLPEIETLARWKKLQKLLSTYGEEFAIKYRHPITQRLHTSFTLGETATGRMSSRAPNLQNQPRDGSMRSLYIASPGKVLVVADFSQIELRIQAEISKDPVMLDAFARGVDIYKVFASELFGKPVEEIEDDSNERKCSKCSLLGLGYGTGPKKFRSTARAVYDLEMDAQTAYRIHTQYHETFHVYSAWCDEVRRIAEIQGTAITLTGKVRKVIPERIYTTAPNHIVQGTAIEVQCHASINARDMGLKLLLSVHDELLVEAPPEEAEAARRKLEYAMDTAWVTVFPETVCRHVADAKIGVSWAEAKAKKKAIESLTSQVKSL